jgi:hypothetical protein
LITGINLAAALAAVDRAAVAAEKHAKSGPIARCKHVVVR